jgi:uncharacterized delta-60 repeat protein
VTLQSDGKIIVAGSGETGGLFSTFNYDFLVARFNTNGSLDDSFGDGGHRVIGFGSDEDAHAVAIDYTGTPATNSLYGTIVVAGDKQGLQFAIARLTPNGNFDTRFNGSGKETLSFGKGSAATANGIAIEPGSEIVVAGSVTTPGNGSDFALTRLLPSGALDTSFGGFAYNGKVKVDLGGDDRARTIIRDQFDGSFLVGGGIDNKKFAIVKFTDKGLPDGLFGNNGVVTTSFGDGNTSVAGLAMGPGRRFVAVGGTKFHTARYLDAGANLVAVTSLQPTAYVQGMKSASFFVTRSERLPYPTTVYFTLGGTAGDGGDYSTSSNFTLQRPISLLGPMTATTTSTRITTNASSTTLQPTLKTSSTTTLSTSLNLVHPIGALSPVGVVTIPANQTYAVVTINPLTQTNPKPLKTAVFTINSNSNYDIGTPGSVTINIVNGVSLSPTADAYVRDGTYADTNFGTTPDLGTKTGSVGYTRFTYLKFDLTNVNTINSVKLDLFGRISDTQNTNIVTNLFSVADTSWSETGITFNNKPVFSSTPIGSATITDNNLRLYEFDVTNYVKAQKAAGHNVVSFALKNPNTSNSVVLFNSRQAASNQPALLIM